MRAVLCTDFGPPDKLEIKDIPVPIPSKGQVRIKVEACGVNFPDTLIIENKYQYKPNLNQIYAVRLMFYQKKYLDYDYLSASLDMYLY